MSTEPLLTRSTVITVISVLSALLVKAGGGSVSVWLYQNSDTIALLVLAVGPVVTALMSRKHVTPVAAPQNNAGVKLVPVTDVNPVVVVKEPFTPPAAVDYLAQADAIHPSPVMTLGS